MLAVTCLLSVIVKKMIAEKWQIIATNKYNMAALTKNSTNLSPVKTSLEA